MNADDSDAEFEDAVDCFDNDVATTSSANSAPLRAATPPPATPARSVVPKFPKLSLQLETPKPSTSVAAAAAAACTSHQRRNRLAVLRGRIVTEFGQPGSIGGTNAGGSQTASIAGDDLSSAGASETASLQSWGRNLLMEQTMDRSVIAVYPADSMSTHAASTFGHFNSQYHVNPLADSPLSFPEDDSAMRSPAFHPPCSPPPTQPPPPLPSEVSPPPRLIPPPLPPRRVNGANAGGSVRLPAAIPQREIIKVLEVTPRVVEELKQQAAAEMETTNSDSYGKLRGHAKSNSLDRGLSLAKAMKCGPFPPPSSSSKSNSLNRSQCTPSELMAIAKCEDDERNVDAEGVIHQLTRSVLSLEADNTDGESEDSRRNSHETLSQNSRKYISQTRSHPLQNVLLAAVGEEASTTTSSPASSCTNTDSRNIVPHYENVVVESELTNEGVVLSLSRTQKIIPETELVKKSRSIDRKEKSNSLGFDLVDPITRDVERRMSMKVNGSDRRDDESVVSTNSQTPTSLRIAQTTRTLFRGYGSLASGLFRKGFSKARAAVNAGASSHSGGRGRLSNKDGLGVEESDEDDDDEDECISSTYSPPQSSKKEAAMTSSPQARIPTPICRPKKVKKGPFDFSQLRVVQELTNEHTGAVWCIKFSLCGRLMATAGQDNIIRVWVLRDQLSYFAKMRDRYAQQTNQRMASGGSAVLHTSTMMNELEESFRTMSSEDEEGSEGKLSSQSGTSTPHQTNLFAPQPFTSYRGHTADILDLSWSKSYFLLSSGMDRTVKLWHLSRRECLCCFQHVDFVTCVAFMPKDDRYFLSGSLDGKLRMWHIPDKKVALWNEVEGVKFITAITFVKNGRFAAVGTYNGRCYFYSTDQLKYHTVIDVRSTRGKNAKGGNKITGLAVHGDKLLVTSNDSRIRMYDLRDMDIICKFKGVQNEHSQIRASFSPDGRHVICGSEDRYIYLWKTSDNQTTGLSVRKDRNALWERVRGHGSIVSAAIFAPKPQLLLNILDAQNIELPMIADRVEKNCTGQKAVIVVTNPNPNRTERSLTIGSSHSALSTAQLPHPTSVTHQMSISGNQYGGTKTTLHGDVIISADLGGTIKIMVNPDRSKNAGSTMQSNEF